MNIFAWGAGRNGETTAYPQNAPVEARETRDTCAKMSRQMDPAGWNSQTIQHLSTLQAIGDPTE